jgi:hypothetical protein
MGNAHLRALFLHYFRFLSFRCYILIYSVLLLPSLDADAHQPKLLSKLLSRNTWTTAMTNLEKPKEEIFDGDIGVVRHKPKYDSGSLNRAVQRAVNDENFLSSSIKLLEGLKFPSLKSGIVDYVTKTTKDSDVISLFESLDGYIEFKDRHHVQKALEVNDPQKKAENQTTDESVT